MNEIKEERKLKKFSIPVTWEVWDKIDVNAYSIEEAIKYVKDNIDTIPLGTEPEYIDGSYKMDDGENGEASVDEAVKFLKEYWNLSGGIDGEEIEKFKCVLKEGKDIAMTKICGCGHITSDNWTLDKCEKVCPKHSDCCNVTLANDILKEYENAKNNR